MPPILVNNDDNDDDESTLLEDASSSYSAFKKNRQVVQQQVHQTETHNLVPIQNQNQNQLATLSLLTRASSNATAKQVVKHVRRRLKAASKNEVFEEPTIRYGVLDSTGHLGLVVSDRDGVVRARQPRKGEWL